jgi:hypothetical protein
MTEIWGSSVPERVEASRSASDAFLALHDEVLSLRVSLQQAESSLASSHKSRAALAKQLRTATRASTTATRLAEQNAERAARAEASLSESRRALDVCEARLLDSERLGRDLEERVRVLEGSVRESALRYAELASRYSALDGQLAETRKKAETLQALANSFRDRALDLKERLNASDSQRTLASTRLLKFAAPENSFTDAMFGFDDAEVQCLIGRVIHNLACPTDVNHLKQLFRIPSAASDRRTHDTMDRNLKKRASSLNSGAYSFCHASSMLWRRLRRCFMSFWQITAWDVLRLRSGVVHSLLSVFSDYLIEFAALDASAGEGMATSGQPRTSGEAAAKVSPRDDDLRETLTMKLGNMEATRRVLCEIHGVGDRLLVYGDARSLAAPGDPSSAAAIEGAKVVVSQLALMAYDAGTPWGSTVVVAVDKSERDDVHLARLVADGEAQGSFAPLGAPHGSFAPLGAPHSGAGAASAWLEREHGIYAFDDGRAVHYRFVHPPAEFEPHGVMGTTLAELYARTDRWRREHAVRSRERSRNRQGIEHAHAIRLGRVWMRDARHLVATARNLFSGAVGLTMNVSCETGMVHLDAVCTRMMAHMLLVGPRLSVVDFVVAYRTLMLTRHHRWVLRSANALLGCGGNDTSADSDEETPDGATPSAPAGDSRQSRAKGSASSGEAEKEAVVSRPGSEAARSPLSVDSCRSQGNLYEISVGSDRTEGLVRDPPGVPVFSMPSVGMPASCVCVPSELMYHISRTRCRVPVSMEAQRSCIALDLSRQISVRVFLNFTDEPELCDLSDMDDWGAMMQAYASRNLSMDDVAGAELPGDQGSPPSGGPLPLRGWAAPRPRSPGDSHDRPAKGAEEAAEVKDARVRNEGLRAERSSPSVQGEVEEGIEAAADAMLHNLDNRGGRKLPRFLFGYSRGLFLGLRIHAFVIVPRPMHSDVDVPGLVGDVVKMTRVALGAMVGMRKPQVFGMGSKRNVSDGTQGAPAGEGASWIRFFYEPRGSGHAFMMELIHALYAAIHGESLLRIYS